MSKLAVVFWSGTGNTEAMAEFMVEGLNAAGAEVEVFKAMEFNVDRVVEFDGLAFGCPAMGSEVLEEWEFQPMWDEVSNLISDKKLALFGSYDWGDGEWMRTWAQEALDKGAILVGEPVIANLTPDGQTQEALRDLANALVS